MPDSYRILLLGMAEQSLALSHFSQAGSHVTAAPALSQMIECLDDAELDVIYLQPADDTRAMRELQQILTKRPDLAVVLVCAQPSQQLTLEAWRTGASDVIFTPLTPASLDESLRRAMLRKHHRRSDMDEETRARFRYLDDTGKERSIAISPPKFTIGRGANNNLALSSGHVSRDKVEVEVRNGEYVLRDLGSKHGMFVNGVRIEEVVLNHGDRIWVGGLQGEALTFQKGDLLQFLLAGRSRL